MYEKFLVQTLISSKGIDGLEGSSRELWNFELPW